jgi:hypothetical protein
MKAMVAQKKSPWIDDWRLLQQNPHDSLDWKPRPETVVVRGARGGSHDENYTHLYNDIAAAYSDCLDWKISGDTAKANKAAQILNAWSSNLVQITGTNDKYLASGIYGYEIVNAAEILRSYSGWSAKDVKKFQDMLLRVFYPMNREFLAEHSGAAIDHYWANWDRWTISSGCFTTAVSVNGRRAVATRGTRCWASDSLEVSARWRGARGMTCLGQKITVCSREPSMLPSTTSATMYRTRLTQTRM